MLISSSCGSACTPTGSRRALHRAWASSSHCRVMHRPDVVASGQQCKAMRPDGTAYAQSDEPNHGLARRRILLGVAISSLLGLNSCTAVHAEEYTLPKAYKEVVRQLSKALKESIQAEQAGDSEAEVRRKADPAKEALQTFVKRWRDDPKVKGHPSYQAVIGVLSELQAFYSKAGPRARMPPSVQARLLGYLDAAQLALKPAPSSGAGPEDDDDEGLRSLLPA